MKKLWFSLVFLFVSVLPSWAIDIPLNCRVPNRQPGYCCWASLEMLGRTHNIKSMFDLVEQRSHDPSVWVLDSSGKWIEYKNYPGYSLTVQMKLEELNVSFILQPDGVRDMRVLDFYTNAYGCVVGMNRGAFKQTREEHAVVLTYYDDYRVEYVDPNRPKDLYYNTREWFDYYWSGFAVVVKKH